MTLEEARTRLRTLANKVLDQVPYGGELSFRLQRADGYAIETVLAALPSRNPREKQGLEYPKETSETT